MRGAPWKRCLSAAAAREAVLRGSGLHACVRLRRRKFRRQVSKDTTFAHESARQHMRRSINRNDQSAILS